MIRITLRLPANLNQMINAIAQKENTSKNAIIVSACKALIVNQNTLRMQDEPERKEE